MQGVKRESVKDKRSMCSCFSFHIFFYAANWPFYFIFV